MADTEMQNTDARNPEAPANSHSLDLAVLDSEVRRLAEVSGIKPTEVGRVFERLAEEDRQDLQRDAERVWKKTRQSFGAPLRSTIRGHGISDEALPDVLDQMAERYRALPEESPPADDGTTPRPAA